MNKFLNKLNRSHAIIPIILVVINAALLFFLVGNDPAAEIVKRVPGLDERPPREENTGPVKIEGTLSSFDVVPADSDARWSRFRTADSRGIATDAPDLARQWPETGPEILWQLSVGEGHASTAVFDGKVYMIDYDRENQGDLIRCMSLDTGEDIWQYFYPVQIKRNHGMSRTIPAVTEDHIVTIGPKCHVTCLDAKTGEFKWMINLESEYGTTIPHWYAGQCPLIDQQGRAIIAPAGNETLVMAVDCETGQVVWETPNTPNWEMTHSSLIPMEFNGRETYVYVGSRGVAGICAETGELLWQTDKWNIRIATVPSPVIVGNDRIFLTGGYNAGSVMLRLIENEGEIEAKEEFRLGADVFASEQQTPILYEDHIFAVRPDGQFACIDTDGNLAWTSGSANTFGLGPFLIADGLIYVMDDYGVLTLLEASSERYNQLARAEVIENGHDAWGPMTLVDGKLILRDMTQMVCIDVGN